MITYTYLNMYMVSFFSLYINVFLSFHIGAGTREKVEAQEMKDSHDRHNRSKTLDYVTIGLDSMASKRIVIKFMHLESMRTYWGH